MDGSVFQVESLLETVKGWVVDGSDQYLAVPNLTSRPACKTVSVTGTGCVNSSTSKFKPHAHCFFKRWNHGWMGWSEEGIASL